MISTPNYSPTPKSLFRPLLPCPSDQCRQQPESNTLGAPSLLSHDLTEELQFEVTKYREKAEIAFQHLWVLYNVQNFRALQGHASVESFASVSTRLSVRTVDSISSRIAECSAHCTEDDGELDPIRWLHEQASQANLHPPPISSQVLSDYEGEDAISEDDWSVRVGLNKASFTEIMVHRTSHQPILPKC